MSEIIGLITARGGSKTIPGKNLKTLAGKPTIAWTIEAALQSPSLNRVIVSTDDAEIAEVSRQWGAEVPFMRPPELARDDSPHIDVIEHAIRWLGDHDNDHPDYMVLLQPTTPLRASQDIEGAVHLARLKDAVAVVSVCEAVHHPFKTHRLSEDGTLTDFMSSDIAYKRRQDLPPAYAQNGAIYVNRRESLLRDRTVLPEGAYAYLMPPERSLDLDSLWDFHLADLILRERTDENPGSAHSR